MIRRQMSRSANLGQSMAFDSANRRKRPNNGRPAGASASSPARQLLGRATAG